jgi:hypothetical protein
MKLNIRLFDRRADPSARLAGGFGAFAARQDAEGRLRRAVLANLLWEDLAYEDGVAVVENIRQLIPQVAPEVVAQIAMEARLNQKLRHVPLLMAREMARLESHRGLVGQLLPEIIQRPDELAEFLALYWQDGKQPLAKQVKLGLGRAFGRFNEYQLAKWNREAPVELRDVLFLVHARPADSRGRYTRAERKLSPRELSDGEALYRKLAENSLAVPDTWEVALSAGRDKRETFTRLIEERKLGALAFLRNLRSIQAAGVERGVIMRGFETINPRWLVPLNYLAAARHAPDFEREIEALMLKGLAQAPRLAGYTVFIVDVSGSMSNVLSTKSDFNRLDAAMAMAMLAAEMCEHIAIYATAGSDPDRKHATQKLAPRRGFGLAAEIQRAREQLGGGGIFTRQCLEAIAPHEQAVDRIIIFSDSQDCDLPDRRLPKPFGQVNYLVDVSAHQHGINYQGVWTAEISGWSEHFLSYIAALEGAVEVPLQETEAE